jgi:hypothetical protein
MGHVKAYRGYPRSPGAVDIRFDPSEFLLVPEPDVVKSGVDGPFCPHY